MRRESDAKSVSRVVASSPARRGLRSPLYVRRTKRTTLRRSDSSVFRAPDGGEVRASRRVENPTPTTSRAKCAARKRKGWFYRANCTFVRSLASLFRLTDRQIDFAQLCLPSISLAALADCADASRKSIIMSMSTRAGESNAFIGRIYRLNVRRELGTAASERSALFDLPFPTLSLSLSRFPLPLRSTLSSLVTVAFLDHRSRSVVRRDPRISVRVCVCVCVCWSRVRARTRFTEMCDAVDS